MFKKLSIVIVNWNSNKLVDSQLKILNNLVSKVIVVDNNSNESIRTIIKKYKNVSLIQNNFNKGFASACNQGLSTVKTEWTLFLNPDVEITKKNLSELLSYSKIKNLDAVSIKSNNNNYSKSIPTVFSLISEFTFLNKIIPQRLFKSKTLIGGILFIKTEVIKDLGGWDERFFLWFEDSDLTKRLLDNKYQIGFAPINIKHLGGFSLKKLTKTTQKDFFFNAMDVYSKKYFKLPGQIIINKIKARFTNNKIISVINKNIISIVVPNLKKDLLDNFLSINSSYFSNNLELIIVTSALNTESIWEYRKKYKNVKFILISENKGFSHTVNIGFRASTGKYIGTCNDDVILSKDWLSKLIKNVDNKTGSINPIILNVDKSIESAGINIELKGKAEPVTKVPVKIISRTDATNAACVIYNKEALIKTGIFDEKFGSYLEDIDLSLRLTRNGYNNKVVKNITVTHLKHQTSSKINFNKSYYDFKNWILVIFKNWSIKDLLTNLYPIILERTKNMSGLIKSNKKGALAILGMSLLAIAFIFTRLYKIDTSLLFFNDIGRDFLVLFRWQESGKPPLLGPQTSALPYNQSAFYFYMLYPMYLLSGHSPYATIFTAVIFYILIFIFGLIYLKKESILLKSFVFSFLLMIIHPQFIIQNRFVWNPTFLGPLILLSFYSFQKLRTHFNKINLAIFALSISFAVSLNYSAAPLFIALMLWGFVVFFKKFNFIKFYLAAGLGLLFWNLPTIAFELRHGFLLTKMLLSGNRPPQVSITFIQKTADLYKFVFYSIPYKVSLLFSGFIGVFSLITFQKNLKHKLNSSHLASAVILLALTLLITYLAPISMQAHYIFAILTMLFIVISLLDLRLYILTLVLLGYFWLNPTLFKNYFTTSYRTVEETQACAKLICTNETDPMFISVQAGVHPYHNGMEFKYMFSQAGCTIKELDTQINEANTMAVVVDYSEYTHGKTKYNELAQFGDSSVNKSYICSDELSVVILERK